MLGLNLWRVTNEYKELEIMLSEVYGDDDEQLEQGLDNLLAVYEPVIEGKAEELAKYVKNLQALAKMQKEQAKELTEMAKANEKKAERVMNDLAYAMGTIGLGAVQAGAHQFRFKKGSTVVEADLRVLPSKYIREKVTKEPDKVTLAKELKAGVSIAGARLVKNPDKLELK